MRSIAPARDRDTAELADLTLAEWDAAHRGVLDDRLLDERLAQPAHERHERWAERIAAGGVLVARDEHGRLVGVVRSAPAAQDGPLLSSLLVRADARGDGLGAELVHAAVGDGPAHLWVFEAAARARRFHERHGFVLDGTRQRDRYGWELRMVRR